MPFCHPKLLKINTNKIKCTHASLLHLQHTSIVLFVIEPSGPPRDVRVTPESSTSLRVTWEPPDRDQWNGNILGYYLGHRPYALSADYNFQTVEVISD